MAILLALELASTAACTGIVQPCLDVAPIDEGKPSLDVGSDSALTPCLSPLPDEEPSVGPCLEVTLPEEPPLSACLMVVPPPEDPQEEPTVTPCLAPPRERRSNAPPPVENPAAQSPQDQGATARADVLEKLADSLPPDVLAKLRKRGE